MSLKIFFNLYGSIHQLRSNTATWKQEALLTTWHESLFPYNQSNTLIPGSIMVLYKGQSYSFCRVCALKTKELYQFQIEGIVDVFTFPEQITQLEFLEGTWQSMLSPRIKKPVPPHHLHSTCPFELQEVQLIGLGC